MGGGTPEALSAAAAQAGASEMADAGTSFEEASVEEGNAAVGGVGGVLVAEDPPGRGVSGLSWADRASIFSVSHSHTRAHCMQGMRMASAARGECECGCGRGVPV